LGSDGETVVHEGRRFAWDGANGVWFPTSPSPYEAQVGLDGRSWLYHPVLGRWLDPLQFPDPGDTSGGTSRR
jgi:hypothetical protein